MEEYNNILSRYDAVAKQAGNFGIDAQRWYTVFDLKCQIALALGADVQDVKDCLSTYDVDYLIYKSYGGELYKLDLMSDYDVLVATIAILDSGIDPSLIDSEFIAEVTLVDLMVEPQPLENNYFYVEPLSDNTQFAVNYVDGAPTLNLEYSLDGKTWQSWDYMSHHITANAEDRVYLRGQNEEWTTIVGTAEGTFGNHHYNSIISVANVQFNIGGRLSSLFTGNDEESDNSIIMSAIFYNSACRDACELIVPKNAKLSYAFSGCSSLISVPRTLSDSILHNGQYRNIFQNCTSLKDAPELPATTLKSDCYSYMFYGCRTLSKAPELPATNMMQSCYQDMFYGCTSLTEAPELPATSLAVSCYNAMFYNCTSLTKAPELPATDMKQTCYYSMFSGCSSLTKAPELPATWMARECYRSMFNGCKSLSSFEIPTIQRTDTSALNSMLSGCSGLEKIIYRGTWEMLAHSSFNNLVLNVGSTTAGNAGVFIVPGFDMSKEYYSPTRNTRVPNFWKVSGDENDPAFTPYVKLENCYELTLNRDISGVEYSEDGQNWRTLNPHDTIRPEDFIIYLRSSAQPQYGDSAGQERVFEVQSDGNGEIVMSGNLMAMYDYRRMLSISMLPVSNTNTIFNGLFRDNDAIGDISGLCCQSYKLPSMRNAFANCTYLTKGMDIFFGVISKTYALTNLYMGCTELVDAGIITYQSASGWSAHTLDNLTKYCENLEHLTISGRTLNADSNITNGMASDSEYLELRVLPDSNIPVGSDIGVNESATVTFLTAVG